MLARPGETEYSPKAIPDRLQEAVDGHKGVSASGDDERQQPSESGEED